jgi:hypothetical protein
VHLKIERLELRACPAVTVTEAGSSLRITGDADDDLIEIVDRGGGALNVNGTDYFGIRSLMIDANGGADEVYYETDSQLSLSKIQLNLGTGDDVAELRLGTIAGRLRSQINGGAGADEIMAAFDALLAHGDARSLLDGGLGDDVIRCVQRNIMQGGRAECNSAGGRGDDTIMCTAFNVAGHSSCISDGGHGNDSMLCKLVTLSATGSARCHQTGGAGNDQITLDKDTILGNYDCFGDGGAGDDTMNWLASGDNSGHIQCTMHGGTGDDVMNIALEGLFTGTVDYFADAGLGDDDWIATVNFDPASTGIFQPLTVLLGRGDDSLVLNFQELGGTVVLDGFFTGGAGEDAYLGPPVSLLQFAVEDFEIGV